MGGQEKEWVGCFLDDLRIFDINADQWTTAAQDEGEWRRTAEQGGERFMAKCITAEKTRAGVRRAVVVYPNATGMIKERIAQSKRAVLICSPLLTSHKWHELVSSGRLACRCHDVFSWCYICLLRFCICAFIEAAALRSIVLRYAGTPAATCFSSFLPFVSLEVSLFPGIFVPLSFYLVGRVRTYVFPFRIVSFYLVITD